MPKVAIVIPNYNGARWLAESLESLQQQSLKSTIIVVDNGSSDGSVELLKQDFPEVILIPLDHNTGFAAGVNTGIKRALAEGHEFVALFNNDATAEPDWVKQLLHRMSADDQIGIVTGKFLKIDGKHFDSTGEQYTIWGYPFPRGRDQVDHGQYDQAEAVFGATGGASLYRSKMLQKIGLFDERFFAYFEDTDLSFRAQARGWKVWYEPKAVAFHKIGMTSSTMGGFSTYHSLKNFYFLYTKNMPTKLFIKYLPRFIIRALLLTAGAAKRLQFGAIIKAYFKVVVLAPQIFGARRCNLAAQSVTNHYLESLLVYERFPHINAFQTKKPPKEAER